MSEICDAYHSEVKYVPVYSPTNGCRVGYSPEYVGHCYGTKECEMCYCGGNRENCDFYPEVREKASGNSLSDDEMLELKFYRWYISHKNLQWDAMTSYDAWKKENT